MEEQREKTSEEMKVELEARKKEWLDFIDKLKNNPDAPVTKGELEFVIEVLVSNMSGLGEVAGVALHNTQALAHNLEQILSAIGGSPNSPPVNRTKSGIILP